ncbi:MAG TPA: branched-chain-amino-acid transaminase [Nitrospiria bacterium]|nr:branched-chain-amino-acid transaminase [Nitrospiria bacterium]
MYIYLNNSFVPKEEAKVSVFDHGLMYGDGIFETLRSYNGTVFRIDSHIDRLFGSAEMIRLAIPKGKDELKEVIYQSLKINNLKEAYIRISITRGEGEIGLDPDLCKEPTIIVISKPLTPYQEEIYRMGVRIIISAVRRMPAEALDPAIKSLNFLNNIMARISTKDKKAFDALMLNAQGYITETTTANIFIVKKGLLITPPLSSGILKGITRSAIILISRSIGIDLLEQDILPSDLYKADETFLTNTSLEIMPVVEVDGNLIADGRPGEITGRLLGEYRSLVAQETGYIYR